MYKPLDAGIFQDIPDYSRTGSTTTRIPEAIDIVIEIDDLDYPTDYKKISYACYKANTYDNNQKVLIRFGDKTYTIQNPDGGDTVFIIRKSNVYLQGTPKTVLYFPQDNQPINPAQFWTCSSFFNIKGDEDDKSIEIIRARRGQDYLYVDTSQLNIESGDYIRLSVNNSTELVPKYTAKKFLKPEWKNIHTNGISISKVYQIKDIECHKIYLTEPIHDDITDEWVISKINSIENIGIDCITFKCDLQDYRHHGSAKDNSGYTPLTFKYTIQSFVTNCSFQSTSIALTTYEISFCTFYNNRITGNDGHSAIVLTKSTQNLVSECESTRNNTHTFGVSGACSLNVFYKCKWPANNVNELHSSGPMHTLFDNCTGGMYINKSTTSFGGSEVNQPNHLIGLIYWNFTLLGNKFINDFYNTETEYDFVIYPRIYGITGEFVDTFKPKNAQLILNKGGNMIPQSLYVYQSQ